MIERDFRTKQMFSLEPFPADTGTAPGVQEDLPDELADEINLSDGE